MSVNIKIKQLSFLLVCCFVLVQTTFAAPPNLISPEDDARFGDENTIVVLEWEDTSAFKYEIDLAIDDEFEIGTGPLDADDTPFFNLTDFIGDDTWFPLTVTLFWRVRAVPESGLPGNWSEVRSFHKSTLPSVEILAGADGRYSPSTAMPRLAWETPETVSEYDLEFASDADFTSVFGRITLAEPELDFSDVDRATWDMLEGIFYWRVAAISSETVPGPWSESCRLSKTLIDAPVIIGPGDAAVFLPTSSQPVLTWNSLGTVEKYEIQLYIDAAGQIPLITLEHNGSTSYSFKTDLGIDDETWSYAPFTIYWSIAGCDSQERPGPFSVPREMIKPGYHRVAAYGDSITEGKCLENGYLDLLCSMLTDLWGDKTTCVNIACPGMKSKWGADNIASRLKGSCPEYVLIMFGTNDSVDPGNCDPEFDCAVAEHLAEMATIARNRGSIPIIATIIPVNPKERLAGAQPDIDDNNLAIISMCSQMNIQLVDLDEMFWDHGNIFELFCDWGHPNAAGYQIMSSGFYAGIMSASN